MNKIMLPKFDGLNSVLTEKNLHMLHTVYNSKASFKQFLKLMQL